VGGREGSVADASRLEVGVVAPAALVPPASASSASNVASLARPTIRMSLANIRRMWLTMNLSRFFVDTTGVCIAIAPSASVSLLEVSGKRVE
jgi:hypothetical protein